MKFYNPTQEIVQLEYWAVGGPGSIETSKVNVNPQESIKTLNTLLAAAEQSRKMQVIYWSKHTLEMLGKR
jgi:hypothetical protein